tara:strand:+ start:5264 stop:6148 length:885 start_codon:yes stop_codon:yes gene_type:complete
MKLAVFITGPIRYCNYVIQQMDDLLSSNEIEYDFFLHLWIEDNSNTERDSQSSLYDVLKKLECIKSLTIEQPLDSGRIEKKYGTWTDTHSNVTSMFGMFIAINKLISILKVQPDYKEYTHILRLRTDNVILDPSNFLKCVDFNTDSVNISFNPNISKEWVSDHIMLARKEIFIKIWGYTKFANFVKIFNKYARNPEYFLMSKISKCDRRYAWTRYVDYHIIYNPVKDYEPQILNNIIENIGVEGLFKAPVNNLDNKRELIAYAENIESKYHGHYSYINKFKRVLKRIINKKKAY